MKWWFRKRWRIFKHWWFTKVLGWVSWEIAHVGPHAKTTYQCYGYVCCVEICVTISKEKNPEVN